MKIQHVSMKNKGLILTPCEPKGKFNQASSEVWFSLQAHLLHFAYASTSIYVVAVSKWCVFCLQWELPLGVKISRGLSICRTHDPEIVLLYSCVYETFRMDKARLKKKKKPKQQKKKM